MGRIKTAGLIVSLLGCVGCACDGWRVDPRDVINGCNVDIEPEQGHEVGRLLVQIFPPDPKYPARSKLTFSFNPSGKDVYIGTEKAMRNKPNIILIY